MSFDYAASLTRVRDARNKRSRVSITKRFIETLRREHRSLPMFNVHSEMQKQHSSLSDDYYSNQLLRMHGSNEASRGRVAKRVNGNCLFNSASVALIGMLL